MTIKDEIGASQFDAETWLAKKLGDLGSQIFTGATDPGTRREAFRCAIIDGGVETKVLGKRAGKEETVRGFFERIYGVPLYRRRTDA